MAKKFFNQKIKKKKKKNRTSILLIIISALALIVLIILILGATKNRMPKGAVIKIRDQVMIEMNGALPDKTTFFSQLENVDEDEITINYNNTNLSVPGEYTITLKVYNKKYSSTLVVLDNVAPELTLKKLTINFGTSYEAKDFVESCIDNTNNECIYEFYKNSTDSKGNIIDFSNYTKKGTYIVQIVAKDAAGNTTLPVETELIITDSPIVNPKPEDCKYGTDTIAKGTLISVNVSKNGCAIDTSVYQEESIIKPANMIVDNEKEKLAEEFKKYNLNVKDVYIDAKIDPVLNTTNNGLVGYLVNIEVYVIKSNDKETIEKYNVNIDGSRKYTINKYNLK